MLTLAKALEYIKQHKSGDTVSPATLAGDITEITVVSPVEFSAANAKKHPQAFRISTSTVRKFNRAAELKEAFAKAYPEHGNNPILVHGTASVPILPGILASYDTGSMYLLAQRLYGTGMYVMDDAIVERDDVLALCTGSYVERANAKPIYDKFNLFTPALHNIVAIS